MNSYETAKCGGYFNQTFFHLLSRTGENFQRAIILRARCKMRTTFLHKEKESQAHVDIRTAADCTCGIAGPIQFPLDLNKYNSYLLQPTGGRISYIALHPLRRNNPTEFTRLPAPRKEKERSGRAKERRKESKNRKKERKRGKERERERERERKKRWRDKNLSLAR